MLSVFGAPGRYIQGRDATRALAAEMRKLGITGRALILAGKAAASQLTDTWRRSFEGENIEYEIFQCAGECSSDEIERAKAAAKKFRANSVIGAGGGKVLDTARAVACDLDLPIVNCPTAASSDAPCSALSVVYSAFGEFERYIFYKRNPDLVLVDTTVIAKAPPRLLVAGMGDALATWFEAETVFAARKTNQLGGGTTQSARALAKLCYETLVSDGLAALRSVEQQAVTPALERLVEANTLLSGLGFESGGLAVAHSVHNGLTTIPETHKYLHGEKVAFGLLVQLVLEGQPQSLFDEVLQFCRLVGLPCSLKQLGILQLSDDDLLKMSERTIAPGETAHNEPFEVTAPAMADAILLADELGSAAE